MGAPRDPGPEDPPPLTLIGLSYLIKYKHSLQFDNTFFWSTHLQHSPKSMQSVFVNLKFFFGSPLLQSKCFKFLYCNHPNSQSESRRGIYLSLGAISLCYTFTDLEWQNQINVLSYYSIYTLYCFQISDQCTNCFIETVLQSRIF